MMARRSISGARALVTGASGGLGRALALELGRHGASVVLVARREERLREVAQGIERSGGRSQVLVGGITSPEVRRAALEAAQSAFGGLDILVNNAGTGAMGPFAEAGPDLLREIFDVNFFAPAELARTAVPLLRAGRDPLIVNVGSVLGHAATPLNSEYCASKFALRGLSQSLRYELRKEGIAVMHVNLGPTQTEFWDNLIQRKAEAPWNVGRRPTAARAARNIVRAMVRGRSEAYPTFSARLFVYFNRLFPGVIARIMRRYV